MTETHCEAGHPDHDVIILDLDRFKIAVYDSETYRGTHGYCPGDSILSRSVTESGMWEGWSYKILMDHEVFRGGLVVDIGSNMGWYSLLAASLGCSVLAVEGDPDNFRLLCRNIALNHFSELIDPRFEWVDETWALSDVPDGEVDLIKVDLEGKDVEAVDGMWELISSGRVANMLIEVSPVFRDGYPAMVEKIMDLGYSATVVDPNPFELPSLEWIHGCHQVDILFSKE